MPRPKPPEPLKPRCLRLSDAHWAALQAIGGVDWLRSRITKLNLSGVVKRERNNRIRRDKKAGMAATALARKYKLDRTTIHRITA